MKEGRRRDSARAHFGVQIEHQPCGLILPLTTLHEAGDRKFEQVEHWCPPFGESWYWTIALDTFCWLNASRGVKDNIATPTARQTGVFCRSSRRE